MGKVAIGCFIDLKKAFETVNHFILINKLRKYGIHGKILEWFISYLDNRKQYVFYNGSKSNDQYISCGVPQGSILGPLLFILYINDLSNISESLTSILFADDTTVIVESDSVSDAIALMNLELIKLNIWLQANKLTLNTTKTHYMVFDRGRKQSENNLLTLNNKSIGYVKFTKFLGVIIDEQLNWLNHISYVKNKISKGFGIILRARTFFTKKTLSNLYNAFILPYLLYCVEIWGNAAECHILPIITLQKKIIRFITFSPYLAHTKNLFLDTNILPFKKLVIHRIGIQMFKFNLGLSPVALNNLFVRNSNIHKYKE